jgi:hypothetical protein
VKGVLIPILLAGVIWTGHAQDSAAVVEGYRVRPEWDTRSTLSVVTVGAMYAGTAVDAYFSWWRDTEKPFSFMGHEEQNWLSGAHRGIDKPGHFYGTYVMFTLSRNLLLWGGHSPSSALWWSAGLAMFNSLEIEIGDGFSAYGFDYQDLLFGLGGVGYGVLQAEVPFFRNFNFKVSYWSRKGFTSPINFTSDYDAMTIWLTADVHRLLPERAASWWPAWLNVAVGMGVDDGERRREFVVGFDLNVPGLFHTDNQDVYLGQRLLDVLHWPAPALKFTEGRGPKSYLFHLR